MVRSRFSQALLIQAGLGTFVAAAMNSAHYSNLGPRDSTACQGGGDRDIVAPKQNIWATFSNNERTALRCFIDQWADQNVGMIIPSNNSIISSSGSQPRFNSTRSYNESRSFVASDQSQINDTGCVRPITGRLAHTTSFLELIYPNKSDALAYIQGNGPAPARYASFVLGFSEDNNTQISQKFSIGPLPLSSTTTKIQRMDWDATRSSGGKIVQPSQNINAVNDDKLIKDITSSMKDIMDDLVGADIVAAGKNDIKRQQNVAWVCLSSFYYHRSFIKLNASRHGAILDLLLSC
jgi:hypothetical protein